MRGMLLVLLVVGLAGIVFGVLDIVHGSRYAAFTRETYGGPGPIIGGILLILLALYGLTAGRRYI